VCFRVIVRRRRAASSCRPSPFVFLGGQSEELDLTKAQWRRPWCIWSECPWMCQTGADGVNTTTSMTMMSSCRKIPWLCAVVDGSTLPYRSQILIPT
jgi:hypothetical protein